MLTITQRIEYAAAAIAEHYGETSDQVQARLLGNRVRPEIEQLGLLEQELRRLRPVRVGKVPVPTS
ncbi:MAG TPA: hypothetical protein ENO16_06960 [Chromatiales bacterium]|nr:hypothetical protein [Chromatiales bacterium]